jgi:predicted transcriptional regulator YdeE
LHSSIPHTKTRTLYGISRPESANGPIVYRAAAEVLEKDDPKKVNLETMIIKKGKYRCLTVNNYSKDPAIISRSFDDILKQPGLDPNGYCIEWYLTEKDVLCMVRLK